MNKIDLYEQKAQQIIDNWENYTRITDANYFENDKEYEGLYIKDCIIKDIKEIKFANCLFENVTFDNTTIDAPISSILTEIDNEKALGIFAINFAIVNVQNSFCFLICHKNKYIHQAGNKHSDRVLLMPAIKRWFILR